MKQKQPTMYFSGFSLDHPPSAGNSRRVLEAYAIWRENKLKQLEREAESERRGQIHQTKAGTAHVPADGPSGTFSR